MRNRLNHPALDAHLPSLRTLGDAEYITADYVAWYNQQRLVHRLERVPPAEAEARYYSQLVTDQSAGSQNPKGE